MSDIYVKLRDANIARQNEWDSDNRITLAYRGNELAGEVGEACNVIKKLERERLGIRGSRDTVQHLAEELADVVICADLIAMAEGIDLDAAVANKFNATSEKVGLATRLSNCADDALRAENERIRGALRSLENAAGMMGQWRSTLAVRIDGISEPESWRSLNNTFDRLKSASETARNALASKDRP